MTTEAEPSQDDEGDGMTTEPAAEHMMRRPDALPTKALP